MCLLSVGLDTLALLLRVWLWISVPIAVIVLMVATYFNYLRQARQKGALKLAVEGWSGGIGSGGGDGEEPYIGKEDVVGEGEALVGGADRGLEVGRVEPAGEEEEPEARRTGEAEIGEEALGVAEKEAGEEELGATGKETIYKGILWMKAKYEQYRIQADQRYEQLREEMGRSERRYQELLAVMEQSKNVAFGVTEQSKNLAFEAAVGEGNAALEAAAGEGKVIPMGTAEERVVPADAEDDERVLVLEGQLRLERIKVEELVAKLQANSDLLLKIYRELERAPDLGKETGRISL
jgi:hypothetical protein